MNFLDDGDQIPSDGRILFKKPEKTKTSAKKREKLDSSNSPETDVKQSKEKKKKKDKKQSLLSFEEDDDE